MEIREELKDKFNFDGVDDLDSDEMEDACALLFSRVSNYHVDNEVVGGDLHYPSSELDTPMKTKWEEMMDIDFKEGASFLHKPEFTTTEYVPGLLSLCFGALTTDIIPNWERDRMEESKVSLCSATIDNNTLFS